MAPHFSVGACGEKQEAMMIKERWWLLMDRGKVD